MSYALPKLLFPVAGKPVLEQTIEHLSSFGVNEVILAVNYLADQLKDHFGEEHRGVRIRYSVEPQPLGTGGPIAFARHLYNKDETLLAMNGDILSEIDLNAMTKLHKSNNALATVALHRVDDPTRFGVVRLNEHSRIREFLEKPKLADAPSRLINAGVYLLERQVIDRIPDGRKVVIEREVFPDLANEGRLFGYVHSGTWFDIGDISDFRNANFELLTSRASDKVVLETGANASASAKLTCPTLVGNRAVVEDGANLGPLAIIGRRAHIHRDARVAGSIVFDDAEIGSGATIEDAVIGNGVTIGRRVEIQHGSVIAGLARIHDNVRITHDVYVHPYKEIDQDILSPGHVV